VRRIVACRWLSARTVFRAALAAAIPAKAAPAAALTANSTAASVPCVAIRHLAIEASEKAERVPARPRRGIAHAGSRKHARVAGDGACVQRAHHQASGGMTMARNQQDAQKSQTQENQSAGNTEGSAQRAGQRGEQQRQIDVNRENGGTTGTQVAGTGARSSPARQGAGGMTGGRGQLQSSILPALMANPALMTRAFMSNPFAFADAMSQEMDRLFSTAGGDLVTTGRQGSGRGPMQWVPAMEIRQRDDGLVIHADLPGLSPDDVHVELENGVLTISGERRESSEDRQEGRYHSERSYGAFSRSIALPENIDEEQVNARFENGVLEVTVPVPQQQQQRGRRVPIQSGASQQRGQQNTSQQSASQQNASQQTGSQQRGAQQGSSQQTSHQTGAETATR
jgi:HSP20 family protein